MLTYILFLQRLRQDSIYIKSLFLVLPYVDGGGFLIELIETIICLVYFVLKAMQSLAVLS